MNKKLIRLILILLFSFNIVLVHAEEIDDYIEEKIEEVQESTEEIPTTGEVIEDAPSNKEVSYQNNNTNYKAIVLDNANLLTDQEEQSLLDEMTNLTNYGNIIVLTIKENNTTTESFASSYYHSNYGTSSGTLFLIDMDNREIYIFSDGENYNTITSNKAYIITDNTYKYASNEEYYKCASYSIKQIDTLLSGGKIAEPMKHITNALIAIILGSFICFIYITRVSKLKESQDTEIVKNIATNFKMGELTAKKTGSHKKYNPHTDSSGGGSGGGGGGGSSGGGGGHSF